MLPITITVLMAMGVSFVSKLPMCKDDRARWHNIDRFNLSIKNYLGNYSVSEQTLLL